MHRVGPYCKTPRPPQRALCRCGLPPLPAGVRAEAPAGDLAVSLALVLRVHREGPYCKTPAALLLPERLLLGVWERPLAQG